jgi:hypothetical protein
MMYYLLCSYYAFYQITYGENLPWETDKVGTDTETGTGASGNG